MTGKWILGMDLGGTKLAAALVDAQGRMHERRQVETRAGAGPEAVYSRLCTLAAEYVGSGQVAAVGVASAGQVDPYTGTAVYAGNLPGWAGFPIATRLKADLGVPVWADNDVRCMARGELTHGAGQSYQNLICLTIGTGLGGALIHDGDLFYGPRGMAGEIGHMAVDFGERRRCPCGRHGCLEAYVSGPAIVKEFQRRLAGKQLEGVQQPAADSIRLQDIAALLDEPDAGAPHVAAVQVVQQAAQRLGWTLGGLINVFDPQAIIIGGGAAGVPRLLDWTLAAMREQALPGGQDVPLLPAQLGPDAGLIGAAEFARHHLTAR